MGMLITSITDAKVVQVGRNTKKNLFSLSTFTFFYYLCSVKLKDYGKQSVLERSSIGTIGRLLDGRNHCWRHFRCGSVVVGGSCDDGGCSCAVEEV